MECPRNSPSQNREGVGCGCVDQIFTCRWCDFLEGSLSMDLIVSEAPSMDDYDVPLEVHVV